MYAKPCNADVRDVTEKSVLWTCFPLSSLELVIFQKAEGTKTGSVSAHKHYWQPLFKPTKKECCSLKSINQYWVNIDVILPHLISYVEMYFSPSIHFPTTRWRVTMLVTTVLILTPGISWGWYLGGRTPSFLVVVALWKCYWVKWLEGKGCPQRTDACMQTACGQLDLSH